MYYGENVLLLSWEEARAGKVCIPPPCGRGQHQKCHHSPLYFLPLLLLFLFNGDPIVTSFSAFTRSKVNQSTPNPRIFFQSKASEVSIKWHNFQQFLLTTIRLWIEPSAEGCCHSRSWANSSFMFSFQHTYITKAHLNGPAWTQSSIPLLKTISIPKWSKLKPESESILLGAAFWDFSGMPDTLTHPRLGTFPKVFTLYLRIYI